MIYFQNSIFQNDSDGILLDNCLDLAFQEASDDQLANFITQLFIPREHTEGVQLLTLPEKCFYNGLTEERIQRLISLVKNKGSEIGGIILQNMFHIISIWDPEGRIIFQNKNMLNKPIEINISSEEYTKIAELAEKLTIAFYNELPELKIWENIIQLATEKRNKATVRARLLYKDLRPTVIEFFGVAETLLFN